jgi:phage-related minor tail protein
MIAALENIAKSFTPVQMAQDAIMIGWNNISRALDTFAETGKFKFSDFAKSVIKDISLMITKMLVFQAIGTALQAIFPGSTALASIFKREKGGPVSPDELYMVGEKGPELFVPKNAGTIIPNNQLGEVAAPEMRQAAPIYNNFVTNNISALDSKSVAQLFAENRKILLGTVQMAQRELPT